MIIIIIIGLLISFFWLTPTSTNQRCAHSLGHDAAANRRGRIPRWACPPAQLVGVVASGQWSVFDGGSSSSLGIMRVHETLLWAVLLVHKVSDTTRGTFTRLFVSCSGTGAVPRGGFSSRFSLPVSPGGAVVAWMLRALASGDPPRAPETFCPHLPLRDRDPRWLSSTVFTPESITTHHAGFRRVS